MNITTYDANGNQIDYSCNYLIQTTLNTKTWFENSVDSVLPTLGNIEPMKKYRGNHLIKITFLMNNQLAANANLIEIFDSNWWRIGFSNSYGSEWANGNIVDGRWAWTAILSNQLANEKLTVIFLKQTNNKYRFSKIYAMKITIPELTFTN
jgi:hypothetical protein